MEAAALGLRVDGVEGIDRASSSLDRLSGSAQQAERASDQLAGRSRTSSRSIADVSRESERASRSMATMARAATRLGGALAAAFSVRQLTRYADTWTNMTSRVELSIGAHEDAADVMGQLADISRQTYATIESTTEAFARNSFTLRALGKSTQDQINFTAALNNALAVSGAEGERALMVQNSLSRAMAEGTLRGEDLNNVLNSGSRVAELLADNLGINVTQLRSVAAEGRITSAVIYESLVGAMETLSEESMGMGSTVRGGMRVLSNAVMESVGALNQMYDVSGSVSRRIVQLADAVRDVDWERYAGGLEAVAKAAGLVIAARLTATLAASNAMLAAKAAAASTATLAINALAGASGRQAAAATAMAAANRAAAGALALIGGPVGAAVIAAGALYYFREELTGTAAQSRRTAERVDDLTNAINTNSEAAVRAQLVNLTGQMFDLERQAIAAREALDALSQDSSGGSGVLGIAPGRTGEQARAIQELGRIAEEMDAVGQSSDRLRGILEALRAEGTTPTVNSVRDMSDAVSVAVGDIEDAAGATRDFAGELRALRNRLQPARAAQIQMAQSMNTLSLAYASGALSLSEYLELVRLLQEAHIEASREAEETAAVVSDVASDMARSWEEASKRIDETFADAFRGAFDSFSDFSSRLLDGFKRLLAELAYQATLRPIVVQMTASMGGALGLGGSGQVMAGQGGFGGLGSLGNIGGATQAFGNAFRAFQGTGSTYAGMFGSELAAETAGGLRAGFQSFSASQFGSGLMTAGAGFAGGWAGNQVFGGGGYSNEGAAIGTMAGAYVGSIVPVIGTYLGAAIGSFLGSGLGSLFGGSSTSPSLRLATTASNDRSFFEEGKTSSSPFGYVGFADHGTQRLNRLFDGKQQEFLDSVAEMDNLLASLARSEDELNAMAAAVQRVTLNARSADGIVDQLGKRTTAAISAIDGDFGKFVASLDGGLEEIVATALIASESMALLSASQERLGFVFNQSASGAYSASFAIAELAGGLDNLASMQEAYYQAYFSEAERAAHLQEDLTAALAEVNLALPDTRAGFRALVEAQDLNTKAGREAYVTLLSLAGGFDQLQQVMGSIGLTTQELQSAWASFQRDSLRMQQDLLGLAGDSASVLALAREQELAAMDESLRPFQERIWALQDEAEALNNYHRELERADAQLGSALQQIQGFVDQQRGTSGTPAQNLEETERQWLEHLSRAQAGDMTALRSITQYADRFMQSGRDYFASGEGFQDIQEQVLAALEGLDSLTAEEFLASEIRDAIDGLDIDKIAQTALDELAALQSLHDTTQSQVSLLVDINQSVISVRDILEDMGAVPSFASGGYHSGGLRLVGERGPELEVTGPSRIFDASTTRSMLSPAPLLGGSDVAELLQDLKRELAATRAENRRLLEQVSNNTGSTASAVMQGNEVSTRQRSEQIREQRAANRAARITKGGRVT